MNRAASRALFAPESAAPKLSILIPSLRSRLSSLMTLLANLDSQPRRNDVEVLVAIDSGQVPTGVKRDRLVTAARGDYVVFVEDDDTVAQDYIPKTLRALEERPGTLGLGHAVRRDHVPEATPEIPPASSPRLTVCVPSVTDRGPLLARLLTCVLEQPRADEVEVLVIIDAPRKRTTGDKRNRLVAQASGAYVCHVDDDDLVAPEYVGAILSAVDQAPADAVLIRGQRRVLPDGGTLAFDFGCAPNVDGAVAEDGALWRQIGHLCPVRAEIAKAVPFPDLTVGEDLKWGHAVASRIKTKVRAGRPGQVLYYYEFSPHKNAKIPMQESPPRILSPRRAARKAEREAQRAQRVPMSDSFNHEAIFTPQYTDCSGPGSALSSTVPYREFLAAFVREHGVRSILDLGCGDFEVMSHVDIGETSYLGVDVIVERISRNVRKANVMKLHRHHFAVGDARTWPISNFDLVICKDVVQHWSNAEVTAWLARLAFARVKYALVTNCNYGPTVNRDIATGGWRAVDLTKPPFGVGEVVFTWEFGGATKDVVLVESWRRRSRQ